MDITNTLVRFFCLSTLVTVIGCRSADSSIETTSWYRSLGVNTAPPQSEPDLAEAGIASDLTDDIAGADVPFNDSPTAPSAETPADLTPATDNADDAWALESSDEQEPAGDSLPTFDDGQK